MSWSSRLFGGDNTELETAKRDPRIVEAEMSPGLTGEYDADLREKAAMHLPPAPPEYMGVEGEYDPQGLVKRVALALDRASDLADIDTLKIGQNGGTVILVGAVPDQAILNQITEIVQRVDGTKALDTTQVNLLS